jgi:5-methylcytosine-specific restriction endonuclease McrA
MKTADSMEQELVGLERHIGRVRARQMALLAELDRSQVALADGCRSMVEWTTGRLDVAPETASALVRTSRTADPKIAGVLDPVGTLAGLDIAGLRRVHSKAHRLSRDREASLFVDRYVAMQPNLDRSSWRLWGELPGTDGHIVERALGERADSFPPLPEGTRPTLGQRRADALTSIAQDSLTGTAGSDTSTPLVSVFVDLNTSSGTVTGVTLDSGQSVGPGALEELLCNGSIETILTRRTTPLAVGRRTRTITPALRRAILHRDGSCAADGCTSRHRLEVHHIVPFSEGGHTDPANLTTLCWFHHHVVVHGMGYRIDPDTPPQRRRFLSPRGPDPPRQRPTASGLRSPTREP